MDHLSHALPTEKIFDLLESLRSESLMPDHPAELVIDMLKVIIKWLEVCLGNASNRLKFPQTNNPICSRDLVLTDRATYTIASGVNFFVSTGNSVNVDRH